MVSGPQGRLESGVGAGITPESPGILGPVIGGGGSLHFRFRGFLLSIIAPQHVKPSECGEHNRWDQELSEPTT
jgi:hypothetical protein